MYPQAGDTLMCKIIPSIEMGKLKESVVPSDQIPQPKAETIYYKGDTHSQMSIEV